MPQRYRKLPHKDLGEALAALYGNGVPPVPQKTKSRQACPTEEQEQIRLVNWLDDMKIKHFSVPNGRNSSWEGAKFKRTGSSPGICDLVIPYARKGRHHLYIELKRVFRSIVSPEQKEWIKWLNENGSLACVAKGFNEAKKIIEDYFGSM